MADEIQQAIQMLQLTGQGIGATIKVAGVTTRFVIDALTSIQSGLTDIMHRYISNERSYPDFNRYASEHGIALMEEPIADRDIQAIKRELTRSGVDFALHQSGNGEHHVFVKAANEAALRMALESVVASHTQQTQTEQRPQIVQPEQSAALGQSPTAVPEQGPTAFFNVTYERARDAPDIGAEAFLSSHQETIRCARELDTGLNQAHSDNRLSAFLEQMVQKYGPERVQAVIVRTVQVKEHDGRISAENRSYAAAHPIAYASAAPQQDMTRDFTLRNVHPGILNLAVTDFRALEGTQTREAVLSQADASHGPRDLEPEQPKAPEVKAAEQRQPVSEQPQPPNMTQEPQLRRFDDLLASATAQSKASNAERAAQRGGERAAQVGQEAVHTPRSLDRQL